MPNNKKTETNELTIKETSSKLDVSEATVRKYLKDFDLEIIKGSGAKAVISEATFQALSEIAKLRANGLSIQEIKELKSQEPSKHVLDEVDEGLKLDVEKSEEVQEPVEETQTSVLEKDEEETLEEEKEEAEISEQEEAPQRRRGFNYRYVERQIANDSKRVSTLRQRLKNPNLSIHDKLFCEEALDRRILFLDGWKHILRWISK